MCVCVRVRVRVRMVKSVESSPVCVQTPLEAFCSCDRSTCEHTAAESPPYIQLYPHTMKGHIYACCDLGNSSALKVTSNGFHAINHYEQML